MRRFGSVLLTALLLLATAPSFAKDKDKPAAAKGATAPVNLNTATQKELEALPGVGASTAKKIIAGRPFAAVADLAKVGVPQKTIDGLKSLVTVSAPAAAPASAAAPAPAAAAKTDTKPASAAKTAPDKAPAAAAATGPVDINTADEKALEALPGIGPSLANAIVKGRPYKSVDDLEKVPGIGKAKLAGLKDKVTVGGGSPAAAAAPAPAAPTHAPAAPAAKAAPATGAKPAAAAAPKLAAGEVVNINTAPKEKLDALPGIGPVKAQAIIDARPFATIEDVMKVKGIKEGEFAKIKNLITVK